MERVINVMPSARECKDRKRDRENKNESRGNHVTLQMQRVHFHGSVLYVTYFHELNAEDRESNDGKCSAL